MSGLAQRLSFAFLWAAVAVVECTVVRAAEVDELVRALATVEGSVRLRTIDSLADLGAAAQPAVMALTEQLKNSDPEVRWRAERALGAIGAGAASAASALQERLSDEHARVRSYACFALSRLGTEAARPAAEALVARVKDADDTVRREALKALLRLQFGPDVTLPMFVGMLNSASPAEVSLALHSLADMGEQVVPRLIVAMQHPEARYWACLLLAELGPKGREVVPAVIPVLKDADPNVRFEALLALGHVGAGAAPAVPAIVAALDDEQAAVRHAALFALGSLGPAAKIAEPQVKLMAAKQGTVAEILASWALAQMAPADAARREHATPLLIRATHDDDKMVRRFGIAALGQWNNADAATIGALIERLADADSQNVVMASNALAQLGAAAVTPVAAAVDKPSTSTAAIMTLGRLGTAAASAAGRLRAAVQDQNPTIRAEAMLALAHVAPRDPQTVAAIVGRLAADQDVNVRVAAIDVLAHLEVPSEAVAALEKARLDSSPLVREAAQSALASRQQ